MKVSLIHMEVGMDYLRNMDVRFQHCAYFGGQLPDDQAVFERARQECQTQLRVFYSRKYRLSGMQCPIFVSDVCHDCFSLDVDFIYSDTLDEVDWLDMPIGMERQVVDPHHDYVWWAQEKF